MLMVGLVLEKGVALCHFIHDSAISITAVVPRRACVAEIFQIGGDEFVEYDTHTEMCVSKA